MDNKPRFSKFLMCMFCLLYFYVLKSKLIHFIEINIKQFISAVVFKFFHPTAPLYIHDISTASIAINDKKKKKKNVYILISKFIYLSYIYFLTNSYDDALESYDAQYEYLCISTFSCR